MGNKLGLRPLHVGISVPDMDAALRWYCDVLCCEIISDRYLPALSARVAFIKVGDFQLELFQHDNFKELPPYRRIPNEDIAVCGTKHVCFYTPDIEALMEHLKSCGADCATDIFKMNQNKVMFVRDIAGNLIEFIQNTGETTGGTVQ